MGDGSERPPALRDRMPDALSELARGIEDAFRRAGTVPVQERAELPRIRAGLATGLMRLLVLAHAEARGLVSGGEVACVHADLTGLRRAGATLANATGAWARLRAACDGLRAARGGALFDPGAFPFLDAPVNDAFALGVLDRLLGADTDARADEEVEEIAGAYEALVGFDARVARGATVVVLPQHRGVDLDALLRVPEPERGAWLAESAGGGAGARMVETLARAGSVDALRAALARRGSPRWPDGVPAGALYVEPGEARRRAGAHYTPRALTRPLVEATLAPLFDRAGTDAAALLALRVCDPAMGTGAFIVEACRQIAARLAIADPSLDPRTARRLVAERCLHGVDADPLAVDLARAALWLLTEASDLRLDFADARLRCGDALVGAGSTELPSRTTAEAVARATNVAPFHWRDAFPEMWSDGRDGFDAFVGNPPWVAYAGRAAQPLQRGLFDFYVRHYPSFFGYRTLHGLFIERAASLLAPGGRLGLVVPTSVSDLGGYEPTRRAHDALCAVDADLPDFGNAFDGVFQPAMGLLSTRREAPEPAQDKSPAWRVARDDLDPVARALLSRLAALPPLPPACFGERGFQTNGDDARKLRAAAHPEPPFIVPIREGGDVRAFRALPPRLHLDPARLTGKLRAAEGWREVAVLIRQTARFPIAARADGVAFRNSILACFTVDPFSADALLAWLNAAPIRWLHFMRHRDARQGMPQVKIAHLRTIPRIPCEHIAAFARLGAAHGARNEGITPEEQRALDDAAASALALTSAERVRVATWAAENPAP